MPNHVKKNPGIYPERLAELQRATFIASTGSSLRFSGSKVINEQVTSIPLQHDTGRMYNSL